HLEADDQAADHCTNDQPDEVHDPEKQSAAGDGVGIGNDQQGDRRHDRVLEHGDGNPDKNRVELDQRIGGGLLQIAATFHEGGNDLGNQRIAEQQGNQQVIVKRVNLVLDTGDNEIGRASCRERVRK